MPAPPEIRHRILETARGWFFKLGFTKVTMDEMAHEMGISKKTIYEYFPSKEEILRDLLKLKISEIEKGVNGIVGDPEIDYVEKLNQMHRFVAVQISEYGAPFIRDLQRNAPKIWKEVDERRSKTVLKTFGNLFREGVKTGAFKKEVDPELFILIHTSLIQRIMNPETLSQLPLTPSQTLETIRKVLFEGILTDKARTKYQARSPKPRL